MAVQPGWSRSCKRRRGPCSWATGADTTLRTLRLAPWTRPLSKAASMGTKICVLTAPWGDKLQESLSLDTRAPCQKTCWTASARSWLRRQVDPLHIIHSLATYIQDPDYLFPPPRHWEKEFACRPSPGIWPLKKEPEVQELPHPPAGVIALLQTISGSSSQGGTVLAFMLRLLFNTPFVQYSPYLPGLQRRKRLRPRSGISGGVPVGVQGWGCSEDAGYAPPLPHDPHSQRPFGLPGAASGQ